MLANDHSKCSISLIFDQSNIGIDYSINIPFHLSFYPTKHTLIVQIRCSMQLPEFFYQTVYVVSLSNGIGNSFFFLKKKVMWNQLNAKWGATCKSRSTAHIKNHGSPRKSSIKMKIHKTFLWAVSVNNYEVEKLSPCSPIVHPHKCTFSSRFTHHIKHGSHSLSFLCLFRLLPRYKRALYVILYNRQRNNGLNSKNREVSNHLMVQKWMKLSRLPFYMWHQLGSK